MPGVRPAAILPGFSARAWPSLPILGGNFFRETAKLELAPRVLFDDETRRVVEHRKPLGVVAAIVPWNFPLFMVGFKLPPALLASNTVVLKPALTTPLATLMVARIIAGAVPAGVVNVITDANDLGTSLAGHPDVAKVSFTGSTATGRKVFAGAAETMKRFTLELGGNDPAIVLDDVDGNVEAPMKKKRCYLTATMPDGYCPHNLRRIRPDLADSCGSAALYQHPKFAQTARIAGVYRRFHFLYRLLGGIGGEGGIQ
ncbi:MAG: aldehyde dehydrogenase family protein [Sphingomonadales bacterium]|nr:aldehyde dehydrogenase family protein [Sphingomonadales bacterium]